MSQNDSNSERDGGLPGGRFPERNAQASGIVVLAANREVVYANETGRELLLKLNQADRGGAPDGVLPKALVALVEKILALPQPGADDRSWKRSAATRLAGAPGQVLFVRAFVQGRAAQGPRPVIVLTMHCSDSPVPPIG